MAGFVCRLIGCHGLIRILVCKILGLLEIEIFTTLAPCSTKHTGFANVVSCEYVKLYEELCICRELEHSLGRFFARVLG